MVVCSGGGLPQGGKVGMGLPGCDRRKMRSVYHNVFDSMGRMFWAHRFPCNGGLVNLGTGMHMGVDGSEGGCR